MDEKAKPIPPPKPKGWFSFDSKGLRPAVLKSVAESSLPDFWKAAVTGDIASLEEKYNFVSVDCHRHEEKGKGVTHLTVKGSVVLTG